MLTGQVQGIICIKETTSVSKQKTGKEKLTDIYICIQSSDRALNYNTYQATLSFNSLLKSEEWIQI